MKKILIAFMLLFSLTAMAGERFLKTESGLITLTNEPCTLEFAGKDKHDYKRAFAVRNDGQEIPEGCWFFEQVPVEGIPTYSVAIYVPSLDVTFVYNPKLFSDKKPEVKGEF